MPCDAHCATQGCLRACRKLGRDNAKRARRCVGIVCAGERFLAGCVHKTSVGFSPLDPRIGASRFPPRPRVPPRGWGGKLFGIVALVGQSGRAAHRQSPLDHNDLCLTDERHRWRYSPVAILPDSLPARQSPSHDASARMTAQPAATHLRIRGSVAPKRDGTIDGRSRLAGARTGEP